MGTNADDKGVANENPINIIPETKVLTLNLDNVGNRVMASDGPVVENSVNSEALNKVASLLDDGNSDADNIIKTIEEREASEHVNKENICADVNDVNDDVAVNSYILGYIPDVNSPTPLDDYDVETYAV